MRWETSKIPNSRRKTKRSSVLSTRLNRDSPQITAADMEPLYAVGWSDEAIFFAITVCALFNFYNRWIDATGVHEMSPEAHREGGKRSAAHGYVRK